MHKHICPSCRLRTHEECGHPFAIDDESGKHYCLDCGLKLGHVDPLDYLELIGIGIFHRAMYENGIIHAFRKCGKGYQQYELKMEVTV